MLRCSWSKLHRSMTTQHPFCMAASAAARHFGLEPRTCASSVIQTEVRMCFEVCGARSYVLRNPVKVGLQEGCEGALAAARRTDKDEDALLRERKAAGRA